ncbi:MAG: hypothetical protein SGPRY_012055 [Prymnesium sp.]
MEEQSDELSALESFLLKGRPSPPAAPQLSAAAGGGLLVRWHSPEGAAAFRELSVFVRRAAAGGEDESEWWQVDSRTGCVMDEGARRFSPHPPRAVVSLLDCHAYEARIEATTVRGYHVTSAISSPLQVGRSATPEPPELRKAGEGEISVSWTVPQACPPVERVLLSVRREGEGEEGWQLVDHRSRSLVSREFAGCELCPAEPALLLLQGLSPGQPYEARLACLNEQGWSAHSPPSRSLQVGFLSIGGEDIT